MGAVYLATRADNTFDAQVAIKVIRSGFESVEATRRFHTECQVLANLNHPNIASLLDGGTTADGRPYLVMEHIEGMPIDEYCDTQCLSPKDRLILFQQVCSAVAAAHRSLVVHRDLKPGNILVTRQGQVKLLDFGIAKMLAEDGGSMEATAASERVMTPRYASPEQIQGKIITTATDVYSLGVLLYLLLAGRHPHRLDGLSPGQIEYVLCHDEPSKPSTAVGKELAIMQRDGSVTQVTPEQIAQRRNVRPQCAAPRALR